MLFLQQRINVTPCDLLLQSGKFAVRRPDCGARSQPANHTIERGIVAKPRVLLRRHNRCPDLRPVIALREFEARSHHSLYRVGDPANLYCSATDIGIAAVCLLPSGIAKDHDFLASSYLVAG